MGGGKELISLLLCALTATACTDTLDEAALPKPLSVNVNARDITARAPIHGTALPDASSIGISLLAEDGAAYDGVTYANLKYTASGTAPDQTWSTPNIPTLSSTPAKLVAYYPWADGTDYTAVPVETDSQTDYMYSKWLTGLSNANPNANIVMQHALTAVRVALVKGDFTADVDVSSVSVKSPAFATAGLLDAATGALSGLTGIGEAVTVTADFPLTAQATNVEVMAVPDVSVAAGVTTVTTQIGDRKYSVNINFTESYKQGYIYTYTLTLNNTGMEVTSVAVTPWQEGTQDNGDLTVEEPDDKYIVEINIPEQVAGITYIHNVYGFVGTIDWGDGTTSTYDKLIAFPSHVYENAGNYIVTAKGKSMCLTQGYYADTTPEQKDVIIDNLSRGLKSRALAGTLPFIVKLIHIGKDMGITDMWYAFETQYRIKEIPEGIFDGLTEVTTFEGTFYGCDGIKSHIPEGLFDNCTKVTSFRRTFQYCEALTGSIPIGLFDNNTKVTTFANTFAYCTGVTGQIPQGLFDNNPEVTTFWGTFESCTALTGNIPSGLFDNNPEVTDFGYTFCGCENLTGSIPAGLFDNNTKVETFEFTFYRCQSLKGAIPQGLFDNCPEVTTFSQTFASCKGLTNIPTGLFDNCTKATDFSSTFSFLAVTEIPTGLFDNNPEVTKFHATFANCTGLTAIPTGLFDKNTKVTTFGYIFGYCNGLQEIPEGLFDNNPEVKDFYNAFDGCTALTSVPAGLFDNNKKVTNFQYLFNGCIGLTGESPYTTINVDGTDVKVHLYERNSYTDKFATVKYGKSTFKDCTGLSDYNNIPNGWKE